MGISFFRERAQENLFIFFLECKTENTALILLRASIRTKIWINYKLYSVVSGDNKMLVINLKNGVNSVVLECLDTTMEYRVFVRVSHYQTEKEKSIYPCLFQGDMRYHENFGQIQHSGNHLYDNQPFEFAFYPNHDIGAQSETLQLSIVDNQTQEILREQSIYLRKKAA